MASPERVIDIHNRIWQFDTWLESYKCLTTPSLSNQTLVELTEKCGPIHLLNRGSQVKPPYKPHAQGKWVEFNRSVLVPTVSGIVHDYDEDKLFYRLIINVPRDEVKDSL